MAKKEHEEFYKVFDAESESCDWSDEWSALHGNDIRVGRPNKARLLAIRKRLAAWGRERFAPFRDHMLDELGLAESTVNQTVSRLTVATYETDNRPWMKLRDPHISWSYGELLHNDLRKLAAWVLEDPDELSDNTRAWAEDMVEALLASPHWSGGGRFELLERYTVRPLPRRRRFTRGAPEAAPEPPAKAPATPPAPKPARKRSGGAPEPPSPGPEPTDPASLPEVLLIGEVARLIGVGKNKAYELFRNHELPGGQRIGSRLIRLGRDAVLKRVGIPIPENGAATPDTLRMDGLADLLRVHPKTLYQLIHDGVVALPDQAWITHRPAVFSRRVVLEWLGGKGRDHGSSKDDE
jgi:predicted DNA-binding transcriptional regulator AlpA